MANERKRKGRGGTSGGAARKDAGDAANKTAGDVASEKAADVAGAAGAGDNGVSGNGVNSTAVSNNAVNEARKRRSTAFYRVLLVLGVLMVLFLTAVSAVTYWLAPPLEVTDPDAVPVVEFEVLPGWGGARVAQELATAGLVKSATVFQYYLRVSNLDTSVGEGLYDLSPTMNAREVADALAAGGRPRTLTLVIPEGWRASEVAARLAANGFGDEDEIAALLKEPGDLAPAFVPEGAGLEGFLFPATYEVRVVASAEAVVGVMLDRFEEELTPEVMEALEEEGLSVGEWVKLASIVQSEAASHDEMPIIAGVFLNRLGDGMLLQSDPTVAYGLGKRMPELSAVAGDLKVDTPWNTYTRGGLPSTPISNPGHDALAAVLAPERVDDEGREWLYFLHGTDGGVPVFRPNVTLAAHERDVVTYLRNDGRR